MEYLEIDKAHIIGASMGGLVAQIFAIQNPEKLLSLSLHSTWAKSTPLLELKFKTQINLLEKLDINELKFSLAPMIWSNETLQKRFSLIEEFRNLFKEKEPGATKETYILQTKAISDVDLLPFHLCRKEKSSYRIKQQLYMILQVLAWAEGLARVVQDVFQSSY